MPFDEYVDEHGDDLLRFAYLLTGDPHLAEDLTQTVLFTAYRKWRRVAAADHPHAYVRKMLVNAHADWHRKRSSSELPTDPHTPMTRTEVSPVDETGATDARDELRHLLAGLSPRARTVLVLRYYLDLDDKAAGELLGVAPSTVRATAARALATLRAGRPVSDDVTMEQR